MLRSFVALAVVVASSSALAEDAGFPAERFRPSTTRDGLLDVEWGGIGEHLQWDAALWANYALNPLVVYDGDERVGALVAHRVGANLTGSIALFDWFELAADVPLVLFQTRDDAGLPTVVDASTLSAVGLGDVRLAPKLRLLRSQEQFVDLAIIAGVTLPTALPNDASYVGENQITVVPEIALSRGFDDGPLSGFRTAVNLGYRLRPEDQEILGINVGSELLYKAGVGYRFNDLLALPLEVDASLAGSTYAFAPFRSYEESPLEVKGGVKYDVFAVPAAAGAGDSVVVQAFGGVGTGLVNGFGTPDLRVFAGVRAGAPKDIDHDDDGVKDVDDKCADAAEDKDGFDDDRRLPRPRQRRRRHRRHRRRAAATTPKTPTASTTQTAAPTSTTTKTASKTTPTNAATSPKTKTASKTTTAAPTTTMTKTASKTTKTNAKTSPDRRRTPVAPGPTPTTTASKTTSTSARTSRAPRR